jgi:zinc transport system substrate-binding protein
MTLPRSPYARLVAAMAATAAMALGLAGCDGLGARPRAGSPGTLPVVASFYPLAFATAQIGGDHAAVTNLTRPGAEPHELELSPRDVATVSTARVVVYEKGLQPAVDEAVAQEAPDRGLDVARAATLDLTFTPIEGGTSHADGPGITDPHFWLDPVRYSAVAQAIADRLTAVDPAHRADYAARAAAFRSRIARLDRDFRTGLAHCANTAIVTSHNAFGYLAQRYGLTQVGITGLSPDAEPEPAKLAEVATYVRAHHVSTVYAETLVSPAIADTVARETGARVATLDPIEGLTTASAGADYFEVMRSDLAALRAGQGCS